MPQVHQKINETKGKNFLKTFVASRDGAVKSKRNKVEMKTQKETNPIKKKMEKRDKKSTLHPFHTLNGKYIEQM